MRAIFLVVLLVALSQVSASRRIRTSQRESARLATMLRTSTNNFLSIPHQYDYANTLAAAAVAKCPKSAKADYFNALGVRTNKFEAAYSLAVQNNPAMIDVLKEMIYREICLAEVAFQPLKPTAQDKAFVRERLFALPGFAISKAEQAWLDAMAPLPDSDKWSKAWIDLDNSRSGMWVAKDLPANLAALDAILAGSHYRELLHTLTRASLYGEDILDPKELPTKAPGSLRHAIFVIMADPKLTQAAITKCGFTKQDHKVALQSKKTYFGNALTSVVLEARQKGLKSFRGLSTKTNPKLNNPNLKGCDAFPTNVTPNKLHKLGMPEITKRELNYFQRYYRMNSADKAGRALDANSGDKPVPWGYGSCVWDMNTVEIKNDDGTKTRVPITENKNWKDSMTEDGLAIDAGPSGTTDEILSVADWLGLTSNPYAFCALRDVAIANMVIAEHHSVGEILQGSYDGYRLVNKGFKDFAFANPWQSIHWCDAQKNDFAALFLPNKKIRDSIPRFHTAAQIAGAFSKQNFKPVFDVLKSTDYGQEPVPHVFEDAALKPVELTAFNNCVCKIDDKTVAQLKWPGADACSVASIKMALGCPSDRIDWDTKCLGSNVAAINVVPNKFFPYESTWVLK